MPNQTISTSNPKPRKAKTETPGNDISTATAGVVNIFLINKETASRNEPFAQRIRGQGFVKNPKVGSSYRHAIMAKKMFYAASIFDSQEVKDILAEALDIGPSTLPINKVKVQQIHAQSLGIQNLFDSSPIRRVDPVAERLQQRAVDAVLNGTAWLSSKDVGTRADSKAKNKHALASRLLKEGRVFAIERSGHKEFPAYAFDPLNNPIPAMREVLGIMAGYSPFRLASWFESRSSKLGGRRPREVLATDPKAVIEAARAQLTGPVHG